MIAHAQKPGVSSMFRRKVAYLAILRGMIFPKYFLTPPKNHEIGKKSKNGVHFILSVFKVGQGKKNYFLDLAPLSYFFGGVKMCSFFFQKVFSKRVKKVMKTAKNYKNNFFLPFPSVLVGVATSSTCTTSILVVLIRVLLKFRPCRIPSNFCKFCEIQKFHVLFFAGGRFTFYNRKKKRKRRKKVWSVIKDGLVMVFRHKCSKCQ